MSDRLSEGVIDSRPRLLQECLVVFAGLAAVVALQIWITRNGAVISHPMWLDECVSSLLLTDPSFRHVLSAIHGGVDTNGPAFYVMTWPVVHALGAASVSALRLITAAIMLVALTGTYATCRRFVEPGRAAIGALAIAVHPAVLVQTWQVRMYGFWLAAAAWFCAYTVFIGPRARWRARLVGCLLAMFLVTSHWLGIFALFLISVTALGLTWRDADRRLNHALPFAAGLFTLGLCLPLIISQRKIITVPTWIEPASASAVFTQLRQIFVVPSIAVVAMYVVLRAVMKAERRVRVSGGEQPSMLLPGLALLFYPATLVAMSFTMQSVLIERYMLPTVIGLAIVAAVAALPLRAWLGRATGALAISMLVAIGCLELNGLRAVNRSADERAARVLSISNRVLGGAARQHLVFARRFEAYPLLQARPDLADSVALLDFPASDELMRRTIFERDLGRAVARFYPRYRLVTEHTLRAWGRFVIVTNSNEEDELRRLLPGFRLVRVGPDEYAADAR